MTFHQILIDFIFVVKQKIYDPFYLRHVSLETVANSFGPFCRCTINYLNLRRSIPDKLFDKLKANICLS